MGNTDHRFKPNGRPFNLQNRPNLSRLLRLNRWADIRRHRDISTQRELAERAGFSPSWISRLESGLFVPNIIQFCIIAQTLGAGASVAAIYEDLWSEIEKIFLSPNL